MFSRTGAKALRFLSLVAALCVACSRGQAPPSKSVEPSILLVTLDTTRADAIGPDAKGVETPSFNALAARGRRFRQAYAAVPETLPSHATLMTGLYPAGHGIHENARYLPPNLPVLAERLRQAGYRTSAFVSAFVLAKRFGLGRGFDHYDDAFPTGQPERTATETTDLVLKYLATDNTDLTAQKNSATDHTDQRRPTFIWAHYYDPHAPYTPPEPYKAKYARDPYRGEVAYMDSQLGRLVQAFEAHVKPPIAIIVVGDHGEGLGDHGEPQHGDLLYQSTMLVPLVVVGPGVAPSIDDTPVSTRRVYHTVLDFAGVQSTGSFRHPSQEAVLGEAMKPFLEYGWQPQTMGINGRMKAIVAGKLEAYDVIADPSEAHNLGGGANLPGEMRKALDDYPVPTPGVARAPENLDPEAKRQLASLGYVSATSAPVVRKDAPRSADMTRLFGILEEWTTAWPGQPAVCVTHVDTSWSGDLLRKAGIYRSEGGGQGAKADQSAAFA